MDEAPVTEVPGPERIREAAQRLQGVAWRTPVVTARWLADAVGGPVHIKLENLQRTGSFKVRGAYNRIAQLPAGSRVVAASAGNHAQGVALASGLLGIPATVFMPEGAALPKVQATMAYGAEVRFAGSTVDEALAAANEYARTTGATLIHPFDHPDVVAGQATVGLEIAEQVPDARTVVVCTGGGGLLAGVLLGLREGGSDARVVGVQATEAAAYPPSLAAGHPTPLPRMATMADGIAVARPGDLPFGIVAEAGIDIVTVGEDELSRAILTSLERSKILVEPAGAAAIAAVQAHPHLFEPPVVITASGGNVDPLLLVRIVQHGLVAAQRYLVISVRIPDRPGELEALLGLVAATRANVVDVYHNRTSRTLRMREVEVMLEIEIRGPEHGQELVEQLREHGYRVSDT